MKLSGEILIIARQIAREMGDARFIACRSKKYYGTKKSAKKQLHIVKAKRSTRRPATLTAYECPYCHGWHLGNSGK